MVTSQIKNVTIPLSQGLCTPNVAACWLRMKEPHPQSHVTHWLCGHVTNQMPYIFTSARPMDPKRSKVVTRMKRPQQQSHAKHRSSGHVINQKYFIFTFTRFKAHKLSRVVTVRIRRPHATCHVLDHAITWQLPSRLCTIIPLLVEVLS